jgi:hypothetical protein
MARHRMSDRRAAAHHVSVIAATLRAYPDAVGACVAAAERGLWLLRGDIRVRQSSLLGRKGILLIRTGKTA